MTISTEYILSFAKNIDNLKFNPASLREEYVKSAYKNQDNDLRGPWMSVQLYKKKNPKSYSVYSPSGKEWTMPWNYNEDGWKKLQEDNLIYWGEAGNACPRKKVFLKDTK